MVPGDHGPLEQRTTVELYQVREKLEIPRCPDCGSDVDIERFGRKYLWRCRKCSDHTGSWVDGTAINNQRGYQGNNEVSPSRALILGILKKHGTMGTKRISALSGLSVSAAWNLLNKLNKKGELVKIWGKRENGRKGWVWHIADKRTRCPKSGSELT